MARLKRNSVFSALSGAIGRELVFKHYGDKVVVTRYPDMSGIKPSELQKVQRNKLREANDYAQSVLRNPELRALYERYLKEGESVYHKAKKVYFERLKRRKDHLFSERK
jgi:hypothetical protein